MRAVFMVSSPVCSSSHVRLSMEMCVCEETEGETRIHFQMCVRDHLPPTVIRTQLSVEMQIGLRQKCLLASSPKYICSKFHTINELQNNCTLKQNTAVYAKLEMF